MFALRHVAGCDKPAFLMLRRPETGQRLVSGDALDLNLELIQVGSVVTCFSCGRRIGDFNFRTDFIEEVVLNDSDCGGY